GGRGGCESRLEAARATVAGLELVSGEARFVGPRTLAVRLNAGGTGEITAPLIVVDVGARPQRLLIEGVEAVPVLDSTTIMELDALPDHLVIVGGGYIALEFGQMFRRFGSDGTIVQHHPRLLMREDDDVSDDVAAILRDEGVTVLTGASARQVERDDDGRVHLTVRTPVGERRVTGSHLLAATGRVPNTKELAPEAAGIHLDENGYIRVDGRLETSVPGVYAMGDVKGGPAFTHVSHDDFRVLRTNLLGDGCANTDDRIVPYTIFTDPQLARVGLSESEARQQGRSIRVAKLPMTAVARAIETGETRGFMKA